MAKTNHLKVLTVLVVAMLAAGVLVFSEPAEATFPGTNGKIVFQSGTDVYSVNPDGIGETNLTNTRFTGDFNPSYSSGGGKIAFDSDEGGTQEIWAMNPDGTGRTKLTTSPPGVWDQGKYQPTWSSDDKIAFATHKDGRNPDGSFNVEVYKMNADGSGQTNLTQNTARDEEPAFSPDGSKIAFVSDRAGEGDIYVMNADGGGQKSLTGDIGGTVRQPSWSPDGTQIVYTNNNVVYVMNDDGTGKKRMTDGTEPTFSPDCTKIAFSKYTFFEDGEDFAIEEDIYTVDLDSGEQSRVTNTPGSREVGLDWGSAEGAGSVQCASLETPDATAPTTAATPAPTPNAAGWNNSDVTVALSATDNEGGQGVKEITYSLNGGTPTTVQGDTAQVSVTTEGETTITYHATDNAGNAEKPEKTVEVKLDETAPSGSVLINDDARNTSKPTVELTLSATDNQGGSGMGSMRFSNDGTNWSGWEPYATTKSWTLASGKGTRTVYAEFKDQADNTVVVSDAIRKVR